jgi:hypothetical protein
MATEIDLLDIASDLSEAQAKLAWVFRALGEAVEDETDPNEAAAKVLPDLRLARGAIDKAAAEIYLATTSRPHPPSNTPDPRSAHDCLAHCSSMLTPLEHRLAIAMIELYAQSRRIAGIEECRAIVACAYDAPFSAAEISAAEEKS